MRLSQPILWISLLVIVLCLAGADAQADMIRLDVELAGLRDRRAIVEEVSVWINQRRIRIEAATQGEHRRPHILIYRGDRDLFYSVDPRSKAYIVVDRDLISAFGTPIKAARREVDGQMSRLPSDQRRVLERLLGLREVGEEPMVREPLRFGAASGTEQVSGFTCKKRTVFRGRRKVAEICVVAWDVIGIYDDDLEVFRQLANFQRELMGARELTPLEIVPNPPLDVLVQFDGFPLYLKTQSGGKQRSEIRVVKAEHLVPNESLFEVPVGYEKRSAFEVIMGAVAPLRAVR
ncbi:MAG: hypothetical protein JRG92_13175 [Deltaproteobacteria bacterium]|nr:hypothetical protein [Deltaproteobacteria bacterium]